MKKAALSGAAMNVIIGLVSAMIALILLWIFHEKVFNFFKDTLLPGIMDMIVKNIICTLFANPWFGGSTTGIGAILGAIIGSILPGLGTAIGAAIGAGIGAGAGFGLPAILC